MRILLKNRSLLTGKYDSSLKNKTRKLVVGINPLFMKVLWEQSPLSLFPFYGSRHHYSILYYLFINRRKTSPGSTKASAEARSNVIDLNLGTGSPRIPTPTPAPKEEAQAEVQGWLCLLKENCLGHMDISHYLIFFFFFILS